MLDLQQCAIGLTCKNIGFEDCRSTNLESVEGLEHAGLVSEGKVAQCTVRNDLP